MSPSILYFILAALGLSFIVFIHELGHYLVAKKLGMKIEVFSVGFGKPLFVWYRGGVKWQICFLLFGGYVKIAGMAKEDARELHQIEGGFFSKSPWKRIQVAIIGPLVNIVFAFLVFTVLWALGGRLKPFSDSTHIIGRIDPKSELASLGVKPGDTIQTYNGHKYAGFRDLIYNGALKGGKIAISGTKWDYYTGKESFYAYDLQPYHAEMLNPELTTIGVLASAEIIAFDSFDSVNGALSPMKDSGIEKGDRVVWANGELIFSSAQLKDIVNKNAVFITYERKGKLYQANIPRVLIKDLRLDVATRDEFGDWRRTMGLEKGLDDSYFIPYQMDDQGVILGAFSLIDSDLESTLFSLVLEKGDKILSCNGISVEDGLSFFKEMENKKILLMVQKNIEPISMTWLNQDQTFRNSVDWRGIETLSQEIGKKEVKVQGNLRLLNPVVPISYSAFIEKSSTLKKELMPMISLDMLNKEYLFLGAALVNESVTYNPPPTTVFSDMLVDSWKTIKSLVSGSLSPKWLSGPVGMVKIMHDGWKQGIKDAFYWIGLISLNLGIINLLPIPVLDGGYIFFSLWEIITKKRISAKAMEKMLLPFVILLIMLFIYTTYQDLSRLFL
jgi:regulator of sigma E protease